MLLALLIMSGIWLILVFAYFPKLLRCWCEPMIRRPVVIFESDDWGAGPLEQAGALAELRKLLATYKDQQGRHPVMTLGVVLAIADTAKMREENLEIYHSQSLVQPLFADIRNQMALGLKEGVFDLQLHGSEHYWPESIMRASKSIPEVSEWLRSKNLPLTEELPSHLQARWTDASVLPSQSLPASAIEKAVLEEVKLFKECFTVQPKVAVATTFIWNRDVEQAWARQGIEVIVTPGSRYTLRDEEGKPGGVDKQIYMADQSDSGQIYMVRDIYFEPVRGHLPEKLVADVKKNTNLGRASLVEIHRINFIRDSRFGTNSLKVLAEGLDELLKNLPMIHFMTTYELAKVMAAARDEIIEQRFLAKFRVWLRRVSELRGFGSYAKLTGLMIVLWTLKKLMGDEWRLSSR